MKFSRIFIGCTLAMASMSASAQPLQVTGWGPVVTTPLEVDVKRIEASAAMMTAVIQSSGMNVSSAVHSSGTEASKAQLSAASKTVSDNVMTSSMQMKLEMDFKAELEARKQESLNKLIVDESKASVKFVEEFLRRDDIKVLNISEAIEYARTELDPNAKIIEPPRIGGITCKKGDAECEKIQKVGFERTFKPSEHIAIYKEMCSSGKKQKANKVAETRSRSITNIESAKKTQDTLSKTNSKAAQSERLQEQSKLSCTPEMVEKGLCGEITKGDYIEKVLKNEVIPNGDTSASNLYSPSSVGGAGIINLDNPEIQNMAKMIEFDALEKTEGGKKDLPDIVQTYRNSTQLKAAEAFVDNIINLDAVGNQPTAERTKPSSVEFQTMYMSRASQLDLARSTLNESVAERRGDKLSGISTSILKEGEVIKEAEDGAGALDLKWHDIQSDMDAVSPQNIDKLTAMSDNQIWLEMYKALVKKNETQYSRMLRLERQSLLVSSLLSAEVNDPENIEYMKKISKK
ncbi:hypothetical protein OTK49_21665 [Vibrio coralliirubri]|uniref:hypothetical protein n=1 Tax=Vibrio coralliirubri TaxID=1516159 RepID=UPI002284D8CB|nr:hypothetical protein [Vibrio coralliirubri]MCY9865131.1 hypothetical protein [Vibrio coralliirubri]